MSKEIIEDLDNLIKWWKLTPKYPKPIHKKIMLQSLWSLRRKLKKLNVKS